MRVSLGHWVALGALAAVVVATFAPWAYADLPDGRHEGNGTGGDGYLAMGLAAVGVLVLFTVRRPVARRISGAILFALVLAIGIIDLTVLDRSLAADDMGFARQVVHVGWGLYLLMLAGAVGGIAAILAYLPPKAAPAEPPAAADPPAPGAPP